MAIRKPHRTRLSGEGNPDLATAAAAAASQGPTFLIEVAENGGLVLPAEVCSLLRLQPGSRLELEITFDGAVLRPIQEGHDARQWWFWTEGWQAGEREADTERERHEPASVYASDDDFLAAIAAQSNRTSSGGGLERMKSSASHDD